MILSEYKALVEERVRRETQSLASGAVTSMEEYKSKVGLIKGLNLAVQLLQDLVQGKPAEERSL